MSRSDASLTPREMEIITFMTNGLTSREIGEALAISRLTVDKHKQNMIQKLNARNAVHMIVMALKLGLIQITMLRCGKIVVQSRMRLEKGSKRVA